MTLLEVHDTHATDPHSSLPHAFRSQGGGGLRNRRLPWLTVLFVAVCLTMMIPWSAPANAQRPETTELLPDETLVFVRAASIPRLIERWNETSTGRMLNDDQVRPLLEAFYDTAADEFTQVEDQVGLSLDELTQLPQGEVAFALVGEDNVLSLVLFVEVGGQLEAAQTLLDSGESFARDQGASAPVSEPIGDVELRIVGDGDEQACYFVRDETICISNDPQTARNILARWDGTSGEKRFFDSNRKYVTIMNRCRSVDGEQPQLEFFVDPIEIARVQAQQSLSGRAGFAFIPTIGLDGFLGVGGTMTMATRNYDSVMHVHALISNPRKGVMQAIAMKPGEISPPAWVPRSAITYNTINWDFTKTYETIIELVDGFIGEGSAENRIEDNFNEPLEISLQEDILAQLEGRVTYVQWLQEPVMFNSQTLLLGLKLNEPGEAQDLIDDLLERFDEEGRIEEASFKGVPYFKGPENNPNRRIRRNDDGQVYRDENGQPEFYVPEDPEMEFRSQQPCLAILGDHLLFSDSEACLQAAITASQDQDESLQGDPDFELIESEITRLVGTNYPGAVLFSRPEESMKFLFGLAKGDDLKNLLNRGADEQPVVGRIRDAMEDNPLPDFEDLESYLAPGGGVMTNDETGLHVIFFSLRQ